MDFIAARQNMVESQIRTNRIVDEGVIAALAQIPREVFVPKPMRGFAYVDDDLDVGGGRYLVEPLVLARLLQAAAVGKNDVVLVIGDATGYATAVVARLAQTVVAVECDHEWVVRSSAALADLGVDNAAVMRGDLAEGIPAQAPYDAIVFAGAVPEIPAGICRQLAEGGRLAAVVEGNGGCGKGVLVIRTGEAFGRREVFDAGTPLLPGFEVKRPFQF